MIIFQNETAEVVNTPKAQKNAATHTSKKKALRDNSNKTTLSFKSLTRAMRVTASPRSGISEAEASVETFHNRSKKISG